MKPEDINWDVIPKQYDRVVQCAYHVWALNDDERYLLVDGWGDKRTEMEVGSTFKNNTSWPGTWRIIATRPVEDKVEFYVVRSAGGLSGPYTRDQAVERAGGWAKANHTSYTITRIIPVLEVSVGDVVVKEL